MRKVVVSGMVGNALEWYDFALYGHFVPILTKLFFPNVDPVLGLIAAFGVFAAGFFMRPIGAILFGYIGDTYGRKLALTLSILTMAIPTACIGLLPGYNQIGIWAPVVLTIVRLLQGLSLGGAFSGSIAFVLEHSPTEKRGLIGSTTMMSMNIGILAGTAVATLFAWMMPEEAFVSWGWRIPFIMGLAVGLVGLYIRNNLHESPQYEEAKSAGTIAKAPVRELLTTYFQPMMYGIIIYITVTIPFYTLVIFLKTYMTNFLGHSFAEASLISTIALILCTIVLPISGHISDKIGRKPVLMFACFGFIFLSYPAFYLMCQPGFVVPLLGQCIFGTLVGFYMGPVPAVLAELYPTSIRYTGIGLSYNISAAVLGGTVPAIATELIHWSGDNYALSYYIIFFCIVTFIGLYRWQDHGRKALI